MDNLTEEDIAYMRLVLHGTRRGREIAAKLPKPHHKKMVKKMKPVIDNKPEKAVASSKPYRTDPDYKPREA